jgi:hypothetical protein
VKGFSAFAVFSPFGFALGGGMFGTEFITATINENYAVMPSKNCIIPEYTNF